MESLTIDMVQYDCPYIDTSEAHEVSFFAMHWDFNAARQQLETRILVTGADRTALDQGLTGLREHDNMRDCELLSKRDGNALIRSKIDQTSAMKAVRDNDGYITGPFEISEGSEIWHVGFDSDGVANDALSDLDRHNDFSIETRESISFADYLDLIQNVGPAQRLLEACRDLSSVERATLERAFDAGYFEDPRDATLSDLATEFGVSKTAVSKNLRRGERKILDQVVGAVSELDE
jgi:predicted DNA binding protein